MRNEDEWIDWYGTRWGEIDDRNAALRDLIRKVREECAVACPNCGPVHEDIGCTACGWTAHPSPASAEGE